jgi:hypothetical protein
MGYCIKHGYFSGGPKTGCPNCPIPQASEHAEPDPECPWCETNRHVRATGEREFWCAKCKRTFDGIDDGTIAYGPPDRRINREERHEEKRAKRLGKRR